MNRRKFVSQIAIGAAGLGLAAGARPSPTAKKKDSRGAAAAPRFGPPTQRLFPLSLPNHEWVKFNASGYTAPVCGVIYRRDDPVQHGMPLGGISTGYLDLETNGTFGFTSLFNSGVPVFGPLRSPFLGVSVEGKTWVLTLDETVGAENAEEIHYWGHYPIVDLEYETTTAVTTGLRAWTPFIPGDALASNIPAAVFEIHLRNGSALPKTGALAISFPGPTQAEAQIAPASPRETPPARSRPHSIPIAEGSIAALRREVSMGDFHGIEVRSEKGTNYVLGVIGDGFKPRFGGALSKDAQVVTSGWRWKNISRDLPLPGKEEFATSMAVDFSLEAGEEKIVRFLLTWYSPIWKGEGDHSFGRMYSKHYKDAVAVASVVSKQHASLLQRIVAWQQAIYSADEHPVWLRESLVNILHLITKTGYWAVAQHPIGDWCREEDGLFGMNESPRECPQMECIPCSFYGNVPIVYFFPELALSTLRGYKAYQYPDGAAPWVFGGCTAGMAEGHKDTDGAEMASPSPGYQTTLNGPCYADMVDRYWQRTGDEGVLREFYPSVKKNTIYTMGLRSGPNGIASVPNGNRNPTQPTRGRPGAGLDWFEGNGFYGMTPHIGGIHLAHLRIVQRMADKLGDTEFASQCEEWLRQGSASVETHLWTGKYYLNYLELETGKKSDLVFGYQLDGDWMCFYHGLPTVFRSDRAKIALQTIKETCMALTPYGAANFANPDGTPATTGQYKADGWGRDYGSYGCFIPEILMLATTYMYQGQRELGLELAENCWRGIVEWGYPWIQPNLVNGATGERMYGSDYYQNMMLWAVPAGINNHDIGKATGHGSLVERVIRAGKKI